MQEVGKFWQARGAAQKQNLAWVCSLLQVKLLSLTPSTVAHACSVFLDDGSKLGKVIKKTKFRGSLGPGGVAYSKTDLGRFLAGVPVPEVLNSNKGKTAAKTLAAFDVIQAMSARSHRDINRAVLSLAASANAGFKIGEVELEKPLGEDAIVDAIVPAHDRRVHLEFHYLSNKECSPNKIATYIMKKLRIYSFQYNLIDR